jgi:chromosome segregation ATPase
MQDLVASLKRDLSAASEDVKSLSESNDDLTRSNEDLELRLSLLKDAATSDEAHRQKQFDDAIEGIQAELAAAEDANRDLQNEKDSQDKVIAALHKEVNDLKEATDAEREDLTAVLEALRDELSVMQMDKDNLEEAKASLQGDKARLQEDIEALESSMQSGDNEKDATIAELHEAIRSQEDTIAELEAARTALESKKQDLMEEMQLLRDEAAADSARKEERVAELGNDLDATVAELGRMNIMTDNLLARIGDLEKELQELRLSRSGNGEGGFG